jgi:hypothetical protein
VLSTDKPEFEAQLTLLCQGYGFWLGDRLEAYWKGLTKMHLSSFARCVDLALSEEGPEKIPNVHGIWKIHRELRASATAHAPKAVISRPVESKWLRLVNRLFLKYLLRRRQIEDFKGNLDVPKRRAECLSLVHFFEEIEKEGDADATSVEFRARFHRAMERVPDLA